MFWNLPERRASARLARCLNWAIISDGALIVQGLGALELAAVAEHELLQVVHGLLLRLQLVEQALGLGIDEALLLLVLGQVLDGLAGLQRQAAQDSSRRWNSGWIDPSALRAARDSFSTICSSFCGRSPARC